MKLADFLEIDYLYAQINRANYRSVAFCASESKEGVSTLVTSIALRCAKAHKKTLIVDMNYYRPSIDQLFQVNREQWHADIESMKMATKNHPCGVDVLCASLDSKVPIKQREQFEPLLEYWINHYDFVFFDTSPLNAINRNNLPAEQVCSLVDSTIMVVHSGRTKEADIVKGLEKLSNYQIKIMGWIMNDRDCPSLLSEMRRELKKLARYFPRLAYWLETKINKIDFLGVSD